jgi:hypothetical protein
MDNAMYKTIPLDVAMEHYGDGMQRGKRAGKLEEYQRILTLLKKHGMYDAVLTIKRDSDAKSS